MNSPVLQRAGIVTWGVLALCVGFTLLTGAGSRPITVQFLFYPPLIYQGEIWRILTPAFLHFDMLGSPFLHLLFNGVIWLNFASAIECDEGRFRLLFLFIVSAILSNCVAYMIYGPGFGGLSGVVFALIGYLWWQGRSNPILAMVMPKQMFLAFLGFLLIGFTGLFGNMANMAHLAGLIIGIGFAMTCQLFWR
ncbi:rhomboid family intramembrane serine protease [Suttonella ornithocola]|uniref:Rhomboid protease glpG n=1 Tax=Suttonella ornithocola TaxID=279832 RepID=A0A380MPW4_9GAMM|nr:rhomboid family intramembrane serine protease [Suttonella ornithocola]SUO94362.1 Rhomboid protease glpG [Suttonella ornithocola]